MHQSLLAATAAGLVFFCGSAAAQVQRTFVASYGNDANGASNCTIANPCRSFASAHGATVSGGEIVALDAAGYGPVTITKSISILSNPGIYAGISTASVGNAVTISGAGLKVRLNGLRLNNIGSANYGIHLSDASSSVSVENCTVTGFGHTGIFVQAGYARITDTMAANNVINGILIYNGATADIVDSRVFGSANSGVFAYTGNAALTWVAVTRTVSSGNGRGFRVLADSMLGSQAGMTISDSTADHNGTAGFVVDSSSGTVALMGVTRSKSTYNAVGFSQSGAGASLNSAGNNTVQENATDTVGVITNIGTM